MNFRPSLGFATNAINGDDEQRMDASVTCLSNVAWLDDNTIGGLTDYGLETFDTETGASTRIYEQFAAKELDISPDGKLFVFGINGRQTLLMGSF